MPRIVSVKWHVLICKMDTTYNFSNITPSKNIFKYGLQPSYNNNLEERASKISDTLK